MMRQQHCILVGAPVDSGKKRAGCLMGPDAYRTAGLARALHELGHTVSDLGNITAAPVAKVQTTLSAYQLEETIGWTKNLAKTAHSAITDAVPIFLGGDHALSLGSISGVDLAMPQHRGGRNLCYGLMHTATFILWRHRPRAIYTARLWPTSQAETAFRAFQNCTRPSRKKMSVCWACVLLTVPS